MKDGHVVSAIGRFGGTKHAPKAVLKSWARGFAIQEDNVLLEYNIPPASDFEEFTDSLDLIHSYIDQLLESMGLSRAKLASYSMPDEELNHPRAHVFGCEPDFNAWTLQVNPRPQCDNPNLRSAGGHLHIGVKGGMSKSQAIATTRWLDRYLGTFLVEHDPDVERQKLYGTPGSMRFKPYGLEYRTPSNWWTFQPLDILEKIFEYIDRAVHFGKTGNIDLPAGEGFGPHVLKNKDTVELWKSEPVTATGKLLIKSLKSLEMEYGSPSST
jgi:hypothetical protein